MKKIKVTNKFIKENYKNIIKLGYCEAQELLRFKDANYFTCGNCGWKAVFYEINNNTIISTGYQSIGNIEPNYEFVKKYDRKAKEINKNYSYEKEFIQLNNLLNEFINECITAI